jgi:hypothetical protein
MGVEGVLKQCHSRFGQVTCAEAFEDSPMLGLPRASRFPGRVAKGTYEHPGDGEPSVDIQQLGGSGQRDDGFV